MLFPKLRACWGGGAAIAPTAETGPSRRQQPDEADNIPPRRSTGSVKRAANWKPKLRMIAEDGAMGGDIDRTSGGAAGVRTAVPSSDKKPPVKAKPKPKSTGTVSGASKHADYYRKCSRPTPIPAFSPAPFLI